MLNAIRKEAFKPISLKGFLVKLKRAFQLTSFVGEGCKFLGENKAFASLDRSKYINFSLQVKRHKIIKLIIGYWL